MIKALSSPARHQALKTYKLSAVQQREVTTFNHSSIRFSLYLCMNSIRIVYDISDGRRDLFHGIIFKLNWRCPDYYLIC